MNNYTSLQIEIIKRIMYDFGINLLDNNHSKLISQELLSKLVLSLEDDLEDGNKFERDHPIYSGEFTLNKDKFQALAIDLSVNDYIEFCVVFRMENLPIHGLRMSSLSDDGGKFKIQQANNWIDATIKVQSLVLNGVEHLVSLGLNWDKLPKSSEEELYLAVRSSFIYI